MWWNNMKKLITIISAMLIIAATTYAVDVKLGWDFNPPVEGIDIYIIYQSNTSNQTFYPVVTVSGMTNAGWVKNLRPGYHRFVVVAQNVIGKAPPSNEVRIPTNSPTATKNVIVLEVK